MGKIRLLLAAACLAPLLAGAQSALEERLAEIRELGRFTPEKTLTQLQQMEPEARHAALPARAEFLSQLSLAKMRMGQNQEAQLLADELILTGRARKDNGLLVKGLLTKSAVSAAAADAKTAHALAFEAERLARAGADGELRVQAGIAAGQSAAEEGDFAAALSQLQLAADLARQDGTPAALAGALNALTLLYTRMKEYEKGFDTVDELLALCEQLDAPASLANARQAEYRLATDAQQPRRALKALLDGLELERRLGARAMTAATLANLSEHYLKQADYAHALQYAGEALAAARQARDAGAEAAARVHLGQAQLGLGRLADGKKNVEAGIGFLEQSAAKPDLQSLLQEYGGALERAGDLAGAVAAYHRERALSDELFDTRRQQSVYELQQKYEADKRQRQIESLRRDNLAKRAEIDSHSLLQRLWWMLALALALATGLAGLLYRRVYHANARLKVRNQELKRQSTRDPLTGLYNRRHFQDFMRNHRPPARRAGDADDLVGALFLLDVDHFKHVNDRYGHAAGDLVLQAIAETLRVELRETDMIVRWGGEEFLAFLPALARDGLDDIARRILHCVSALRIDYQGRQIAVNASLGYAPFPLGAEGRPLPWQRALNLIDMALYLAKAHGRNRAYGLRGFARLEQTTMEAIEQDLEGAWRAGHVDMAVVCGAPAKAGARTALLQPACRPAA